MRTAADFFGLMVYLSVMDVALPDPALLTAAYEAGDEGSATARNRRHLRAIEGGESEQKSSKRAAKKSASQRYESAA